MELKTINTLDKKAQDNQNPADERDLHPYKKFINFRPKRVVRNNFLAFISGVLLAFSMPGHNLSFLAWVGFIPLLTLIDKSYTYKDSFIASLCFGFGFNMLVLNWICGLHPLTWMGITSTQSILLALTVWISVSAFCAIA